ncbi:ABC transporter substrate-binding protein [Cellulomonas humilata]|uniref:Polar amino acid transport system substrate-binding protein n=1 Tax=Cellulomonas humilata TaxID=144055 RepID=A0ABU0EIF7_9CELL|nr:ABC transporter substrate-binding protein [Cellulomonas humilata]MDQ0375065.1 polar amino acid transport system substrate-binding protein [Cellulomonas humilata]
MTAALAAVSALLLTACGGDGGSSNTAVLPDEGSPLGASAIVKVDSIADLVPREIADRGTLVVGSDTTYAPAEYMDVDGVTPVGYDVDLAKAIAVVLGLEADVRTADFSSIIPEVGSTYDVGISSFTINAERMSQVNMVQYLEAGEAFAVRKGNPEGISRDDLCGVTVAVQAGTIQEEELGTLTEECESAGKESIRRLSFDTQTEANDALVDGKADVTYADSPIITYAVLMSRQLEVLGEAFATAPQGIVVSKDDHALTTAIQKAVQELIDSGAYGRILTSWLVSASQVTTAELNPSAP